MYPSGHFHFLINLVVINMNDLDRDCLLTIAVLWNCSAVVMTAAALASVAASVKLNRPRRRKRFAIHPINQRRLTHGHYNNVFMELKEDKFYKYTRMSLHQFNILHDLLESEIKKSTKYRPPIPIVMTAAALASVAASVKLNRPRRRKRFAIHPINQRRLTHGHYNNVFMELKEDKFYKYTRMSLHQFNILHDLLESEIKKSTKYRPPIPIAEYKSIAEEFHSRWNLPHCLGVVDGKHIRMKGPEHSNSLYYNYKGYFSVVLMAICDANYNFTLVEVGHVGSVCDSTIFRQCEFGQRIMNKTLDVPQDQPLPGQVSVLNYDNFPFFFIGDEAFPLKTNIMRSFPKGQLNKDNANYVANNIFNYRLCRARRVVENAFGILVAKWRIFHTLIEVKPEHGVLLVQACSGQYVRERITGDVYNTDDVTPGTWRQNVEGNQMQPLEFMSSRNYTHDAKTVRDDLAIYFCNEGSVPWQLNSIQRSYNKQT
ncbi:hypothetical protein B566_EDAN017620 [Ephemera danica]|nr:hypothetical protein B566_EDAN017620 [Ephemera danica]